MRPLDDLAKKMYAMYQKGHSLKEVGKKFGGRSAQSVGWMFGRRGWETRSPGRKPKDLELVDKEVG
jgi:hypothetical protein